MPPTPPSPSRASQCQGFTLVELLLGLLISLVTTLAVTRILLAWEGNKRSIAAGSEAQLNAALAMNTLRGSIASAGYGFSSAKQALGCPLKAQFNGTPVEGFAPSLVPVLITDGTDGAPDTVRVLSSATPGIAMPLVTLERGYALPEAPQVIVYPVANTIGLQAADLLIAYAQGQPCQVFQATALISSQVQRDATAPWNTAPGIDYPGGSLLFNMGSLEDSSYSVSSTGTLQRKHLKLSDNERPSYTGALSLYANIVNLQAYYGMAGDGADNADLAVQRWTSASPRNSTQWQQLRAIRVALLSRSEQFEKEVVTPDDPVWEVEASPAMPDASACAAGQCIRLKVPHASGSTEWQHYRYQVLDSVIPLRNLLWGE